MQYCNDCQVHIRGNKTNCPLCKNALPSTDDVQNDIYPEIPLVYKSHLAIRIMILISIITIVVSFSIYKIFPSNVDWPMFVVLGLLSMWLSLIVIIRKGHNIAKSIVWHVTILSALSIIWDWRIGWRGWSLDYVIPIVCVSAMFIMYVMAKITQLSVRDYIVYFLLDGLLGIIPILFIVFNWINVVYPSIICVAVSIIFLSAILLFQGENIKAELDKRMHI